MQVFLCKTIFFTFKKVFTSTILANINSAIIRIWLKQVKPIKSKLPSCDRMDKKHSIYNDYAVYKSTDQT